jgi:alanine dehydrogenase
VPITSTLALTNATLPYVLQLANKGYRQALKESPALLKGLNIIGGKVTHRKVAEAFGLEYCAAESIVE